MKTNLYIALFTTSLIVIGGCATTGASIGGLETDQLVRYECDGKGFSVRAAEDFTSARVRTAEGSVNLDRADGGEFKGDGWVHKTQGGLSLLHKDKVVSSNCKKAV